MVKNYEGLLCTGHSKMSSILAYSPKNKFDFGMEFILEITKSSQVYIHLSLTILFFKKQCILSLSCRTRAWSTTRRSISPQNICKHFHFFLKKVVFFINETLTSEKLFTANAFLCGTNSVS